MVKEASVNHTNMVCAVVTGLQEVIIKVPPNGVPAETTYNNKQAENKAMNQVVTVVTETTANHKKLASQLQKIKISMKYMQIKLGINQGHQGQGGGRQRVSSHSRRGGHGGV